jgi:hypothetical protein
MKKGGDPEHPSKLHFLSFMVMELLGPSVGHLSLELQTYTHNLKLLVNHGLGMLKVSASCPYLHHLCPAVSCCIAAAGPDESLQPVACSLDL